MNDTADYETDAEEGPAPRDGEHGTCAASGHDAQLGGPA